MGGFACGQALGNVFNLADAQDASVDDLGPMMGKVFLYFLNDDPGLGHSFQTLSPMEYL